MNRITTLFCVVGIVLLLTSVAPAVPISIGNQGFENVVPTITPGATSPADDPTYPGPWVWKIGNSQRFAAGTFAPPPPDASSWVAWTSAGGGVQLSQVLGTNAAPNKVYTLTVEATTFADSLHDMTLIPHLLHADDTPVGSGPSPASTYFPSTSAPWVTLQYTWTTDGTEPGTQALKIGFEANPHQPDGGGVVFLDDIRLDVVPEPSSLALLATGLLACARRKRR